MCKGISYRWHCCYGMESLPACLVAGYPGSLWKTSLLFDEFPVHPLAEPSPVSSPFQHSSHTCGSFGSCQGARHQQLARLPDWSLDHPGSQKTDVECGIERGWTTLLHGVSQPWEGTFGAMREMQTDSPVLTRGPGKHGVGVATHCQVSIWQIILASCSQCKYYQALSKP